jgi:hypothetical protein
VLAVISKVGLFFNLPEKNYKTNFFMLFCISQFYLQ